MDLSCGLPDTRSLALFAASVFVLVVTPGPGVVLILSSGATGGRRAAFATVFGVSVGTVLYIALVSFGLSSLVLAHPYVLRALQWGGALYLLYVGVRTLMARPSPSAPDAPVETSTLGPFVRGFVANTTNPKTLLFFAAFLPRFVDADSTCPTIQMQVLGAILLVMGLASDSMYALASTYLGGRLSARSHDWGRIVGGWLLVILGVSFLFA